jgi:predicted chitinase
MLISPPFLLPRHNAETDNDWIDRCMQGGHPGDGAFPLSLNLGWHGGMHLIAPMSGPQPEPVRAIADGTVAFMRAPAAQPSGPLPADHPQAYRGRWTDNGVVVLRHETEIGEGLHGQVTYFSIYMHLARIHPSVQHGRQISRKAEIGAAGQIYGEPHRIHFEIVCDDANLRALVGRSAGDLPVESDGRLDAVYGQMYFHLPAGTLFFDEKPLDHLPIAHSQPDRPRPGAPKPPAQALSAVHTSEEPLIVALRHAGGEGAEGHRGSAYLTTLRPDGTSLGSALEEVDAEYNLYTRANEISRAYASNAQPAPSAVYELLRFGRVVNTANEALTPADVPHWREVRYPGGQGWVNLNAAGVRKFSDADFPHWQLWRLVDDSADQDSRCDSPTLRAWLDISGDGQIDPIEATARLADAQVKLKLAHAICKIPTEWDAATIERRWGWLKTPTAENPHPFTEADFEALKAHIEASALFPGGIGLPASHWHFQPREFLKQFRHCCWLSRAELAGLLPRTSKKGWPGASANVQISWDSAMGRWANLAASVNSILRKYIITSPARRTHFLAQVYIETDLLQVLREYGRGQKNRRGEWPAPAMQYYTVFYGRGLMQLTWPDNYDKYGGFRSTAALPDEVGPLYADPYGRISTTSLHYWADPRQRGDRINEGLRRKWAPRYDPEKIADNVYNAADSAGFYWVSKTIGNGSLNINRVCDRGIDRATVGRVSVLVNGGSYGYFERLAYAAYITRFLMDGTEDSTSEQFVEESPSGLTATVTVDYSAQRP